MILLRQREFALLSEYEKKHPLAYGPELRISRRDGDDYGVRLGWRSDDPDDREPLAQYGKHADFLERRGKAVGRKEGAVLGALGAAGTAAAAYGISKAIKKVRDKKKAKAEGKEKDSNDKQKD